MEHDSVYVSVKRLEGEVNHVLAHAAVALELDAALRRMLALLKRDMADARLDVRDYEFAETRDEQKALGETARQRLEAVRQAILNVSQYNIFSAIEVAQLTATISRLQENLD